MAAETAPEGACRRPWSAIQSPATRARYNGPAPPREAVERAVSVTIGPDGADALDGYRAGAPGYTVRAYRDNLGAVVLHALVPP